VLRWGNIRGNNTNLAIASVISKPAS